MIAQCAICGKPFNTSPSRGIVTCGTPACRTAIRSQCRLGKKYNVGPLGKNAKDLTGRRFGRLRVLSLAGRKNRKVTWLCQCKCGNQTIAKSDALLSGGTTSCGCARRDPQPERAAKATAANIVHGTNLGRISKMIVPRNNSSGVRGVYKVKKTGRWQAGIFFQGKRYILGSYITLDEAAAARKVAEDNLFGDFLAWYRGQKDQSAE